MPFQVERLFGFVTALTNIEELCETIVSITRVFQMGRASYIRPAVTDVTTPDVTNRRYRRCV